MRLRQKLRDYLLTRAKARQVTTYNQPVIIAFYSTALVLSNERERVEIWQQIGVNLTRLARRPVASNVGQVADYCFRRALRHADLAQIGAIRRDRAELMSKLGHFKQAQEQVRQSAKALLMADDQVGLTLTRITRAVVYYRWSQTLSGFARQRTPAKKELLLNARDSLQRAVEVLEAAQLYHQLLLALLWRTDVYIALWQIDQEQWCWLTYAYDDIQAAKRLLAFGSSKHLQRNNKQWQFVRQTVQLPEAKVGN